MKFTTAILIGLLAIIGLAGVANAQTPTMNTAQKVKLTLAGKNAAGATVPIPFGTIMVWTAVATPPAADPGSFVDPVTSATEFSVFYSPKTVGSHLLTATLTVPGQGPISNTVTLTVTADPATIPTSFTITVGTPVIK
jgi:hypothetical protein